MTEAYIYDAIRTPRGKGRKDGALHEVTAARLSASEVPVIMRAASGGVSPPKAAAKTASRSSSKRELVRLTPISIRPLITPRRAL